MHLCANLLLSNLVPAGMKVRRNFSFWPDEKSRFNRAYRGTCRSLARPEIPAYRLFLRPHPMHSREEIGPGRIIGKIKQR